jgi:hypothetical protein
MLTLARLSEAPGTSPRKEAEPESKAFRAIADFFRGWKIRINPSLSRKRAHAPAFRAQAVVSCTGGSPIAGTIRKNRHGLTSFNLHDLSGDR